MGFSESVAGRRQISQPSTTMSSEHDLSSISSEVGDRVIQGLFLLSSRERSVVQLIEGHTNKSVGAVLNLSVKTVETHRALAMRKLNASSTAELVRYAIRTKLVGL
jgi:DNA-binding NarL/FixJ family response regulator